MKSVKLAAASSLFAVLALSLAGCTAEVVPNEPAGGTAHATTNPGEGNGGGNAGNEQVVGTSRLRNGAAITPWQEPLPNPWYDGPNDGIPNQGTVPAVDNAGTPPVTPHSGPNAHHAADDPGEERYNGPAGSKPW